jgi:CRISPR-associated protein Cas2
MTDDTTTFPNGFPNQNVYEIGETVLLYDPATERYRNMLHIVAYDIRDTRRLRAVARICLDYGVRVEYSVFECDLSEELFQKMWHELHVEIDPEEDAILAYKICGSCVQRIQSMGVVHRPGKVLIYMV